MILELFGTILFGTIQLFLLLGAVLRLNNGPLEIGLGDILIISINILALASCIDRLIS